MRALLVLIAATLCPSLTVAAQRYTETQKLNASDAAIRDGFGYSTSVSSDIALIGAPFNDDTGSASGSAYLFERNAATGAWIEAQKLTASDASSGASFGYSVSIAGDVALVGAVWDDEAGLNAGSAYVFERDATTGLWNEVQKLTASDAAVEDYFGHSVSISGNVAVVGAPYDDDAGPFSGSAYVFEHNTVTGVWVEVQKLTASDADAYDAFGESVALEGSVAFVGAYHDDDGDLNAGAVYVFDRAAGTGAWVETQKLTASDTFFDGLFGRSVSISGGVALIGADGRSSAGSFAGAAYVFERDAVTGSWVEVQALTASDAADLDYFGRSVSISGDIALVGAWGVGPNVGSAYLFMRDAHTGSWFEAQKLTASNAAVQDHFGFSVSLSGPAALVGAPGEYSMGTSSGSAYVFEAQRTVAVTATGDATVAQGDLLTVGVTAQNLSSFPVAGHLVLAATGPFGQNVTRRLAAGTIPPGETVSRTFRLPVDNAPIGTWTVEVRVEDEAGQVLGADTFVVEVTPPEAAAGPTFGPAEELEAGAAAPAYAVALTVAVVGPNPFREWTALAFTLAEAGEVRFTLHDALGREVAVLVAGDHEAGRHVVGVEAGALPSGVYVWRLVTGRTVTTGRLTLMR